MIKSINNQKLSETIDIRKKLINNLTELSKDFKINMVTSLENLGKDRE